MVRRFAPVVGGREHHTCRVGLRAVFKRREELAIGETNVDVNTSIDNTTHAPHLNHRLNQAL